MEVQTTEPSIQVADVIVSDAQPEFDIDKASDEIGKSLGFGAKDEPSENSDDLDIQIDEPSEPVEEAVSQIEKQVRTAPTSWAKEHHEQWGKIDPQTQEYIELREKQMLEGLEQYKGDSGFGKQMREVTEPYKAFITSQGVDAPKAVQFLLNAHYRLSTAQPADRQQYFAHLAQSYGIDLAAMQPAEPAPQIDPAVKALQDEVGQLRQNVTAREQAAINEGKAKITAEVEAFSKDPKHQYFDECSEDIVALIKAGHTLEQAYEKAVYANPVTRAKELSRLQADNEKTLREKSKTEADAARKASATNVRSRDIRKAPTEPRGTMEDTMRATLNEIKSRTH